MKIETVVAGMPYEKDPYFPFQYSPEKITELEGSIGSSFPDDFRWYLLNVGWRKIDYDHRTILIRYGAYLHDLQFEAAENEVFSLGRYNEFAESKEGGLLPHDGKLYFPFGQIKGGNPQFTLRLLISLNDENRGSIWAVRPIGHYGDQNPSQPIRIADDMASFLEQIGPNKKLCPVAEKNNEALFEHLMADYLTSTSITPTTKVDPQTLITSFFEQPNEMIFDGARNLEYQYRVNGQRIENEAEFAEKANWFATKLPGNPYHVPPPLLRREIRIGTAQVFDRTYVFNQKKHNYALVTVESLVGDNNRLKEEYLLHHGKDGWTMLRRYGAAIDDVRVKGVGTFAFNSTYKWKLKKKVTPAWSELPFELYVSGEEDALTTSRIAFVKEVINNATFKPTFETHVFRIYTEFEAMPDDEKVEWVDCYPRISAPGDIWKLFGKKCSLYVENNDQFSLVADTCWDPEHGLTMTVRHWGIE
ncbi:MAG: SMI1/KNR4 family protein [Azovibrio sp.]